MIQWNRNNEPKRSSIPKCFRSLALIPKQPDSQAEWLCLWDLNQSCFDFVVAERSADQSFRDCLQEEIYNSLHLTRSDVLIANMAQLNLEFVEALPGEDHTTHVAVAFYLVHLFGRTSRNRIEELVEGRWLSADELLNGQTADGWSVSPFLSYLLRRSDVLPRQSFS